MLASIAPLPVDPGEEIDARPCACGGVIVVYGPVDLAENVGNSAGLEAVAVHNVGERHMNWRKNRRKLLAEAEVRAKITGEPVPAELLIRGKRCPHCGEEAR